MTMIERVDSPTGYNEEIAVTIVDTDVHPLPVSADVLKSYAPAEWVERPTRAYMNLLELPVLFYVACLFMLTTGKFDSVQVSLAWLFVVTRYAHALIYIGFNHVPLRFTAFATGVLTLAVLWTRFAVQTL